MLLHLIAHAAHYNKISYVICELLAVDWCLNNANYIALHCCINADRSLLEVPLADRNHGNHGTTTPLAIESTSGSGGGGGWGVVVCSTIYNEYPLELMQWRCSDDDDVSGVQAALTPVSSDVVLHVSYSRIIK